MDLGAGVAEARNGRGKAAVNPERWQRVKELFDSIVGQEPERRAAFLDEACVGDPALREEVQALVASHEKATEFLEKPAYQTAAALFESDEADSLVGQHLGPYLVTEKIAQGGMGVVYLAEDSRLDRTVAIKALPRRHTRDPQHRERLRREAKAAARLSHPGIATVYALEEFGDNLYIVSEFVPGRTLLEELNDGPLHIGLLLDVALKVARALEAAHEAGVVHRDLKPENVIRMPDGEIKILDFGLARIVDQQASGAFSARLTGAGTVVGTPAYSSPEQLLGADVDFRTDIFSFGVMLFELATGVHPFAASDPISSIARILEGDPPDFRQLSPASPPELNRIIMRCLRKKPAERYSATAGLVTDLHRIAVKQPAPPDAQQLQQRTGSGGGPHEKPGWSMLRWWQFHQACVGVVYYLMVYPMWRVKEWMPGIGSSLLFFPTLVAVGISANLRFHLWFTSVCYPAQLMWQRRRAAPWIRFGDLLLVALLLTTATVIHTAHAIIATLLVVAAIGSLVGFVLIEPATSRAALADRDDGTQGRT